MADTEKVLDIVQRVKKIRPDLLPSTALAFLIGWLMGAGHIQQVLTDIAGVF